MPIILESASGQGMRPQPDFLQQQTHRRICYA